MRRRRWALGWAVFAMVIAGCSSESADEADEPTTTEAPTTTVAAEDDTLRIMVTNDDGVAAPGIDVLVNALEEMEGVDVTVVAPSENQSGTGDQTSGGELVVDEASTASGDDATAVRGFPADTVVWAVTDGNVTPAPHLVISGINFGQNIGNLAQVSGTVGAALTSARAGIPALAVSQGAYGEVVDPDFDAGATYALEWVEENREALLAGSIPPEVTSINVPTCVTGTIRGVVEVPTADDLGDRDPFAVDCESTVAEPATDVDAVLNGFVSVSTIDPG